MQIARKIIFYVFLLVYLFLCPMIILYSFGYIFQPVDQEIEQTGIIYLSTTPSGARIYLEKKQSDYKTPASIIDLLPGSYDVGIHLLGYRPWKHQVAVCEGRAVVFENIILIPKDLMPEAISSEKDLSTLIELPADNSFIIKEGNEVEDFYIYDITDNKIQPLVQKNILKRNFSVNSIYTLNKNNQVIFQGNTLSSEKYYYFNLSNQPQVLTDITQLINVAPNLIMHSASKENTFYAVYKNYVNSFDIKSMSQDEKYIDKIKGIGLLDDEFIILDKDNSISTWSLDNEQKEILFKNKNLGKNLFKNSNFYEISCLDNQLFLFSGDKGDLIVTVAPYQICDKGVLGVEYYEKTERLLYWTKDTIAMVDFQRDDQNSILFKDEFEVNNLYENGKNITQAFWVYNATHVLFVDSNSVSLLELSPDSNHHVESISEVKNNSRIIYNDQRGYVYYLNDDGDLMKLEIISKDKLVFAPFQKK